MSALIIFLLMVAVGLLWQRVGTLEKRMRLLEEFPPRFAAPPEPVWTPRPEPVPEPRPAPLPEAFRASQADAMTASIAAPPPPPPAPEPVFTDEPENEAPARRTLGFEDIFGRYLPIWAGGVTLAVAGFLIVKYSIDAGLLSPTIRVIFGLLFGTGLIAAAEVALRSHRFVGDDRIRQALAGAGIATLYASVLVAANLYHLIDPMTAFIGLAIVTVLAATLSLRFGAPSAVLGLVGGLAAPALVGADSPNIPLLATYLAITVGGLCALGRSQRWWWLGALAVLGGFGWGALLILGGLHDIASILAVGTMTLLFALAFPLLLLGERGPFLRFAAALMGCAQMAAIVATGGFAPLEWAMFALFSAATVWLSRKQDLLAQAPLVGLGTGILLTLGWSGVTPAMLAYVLAGGALIYGGPALWRLWRSDGGTGDAGQVATVALAIGVIPLLHFHGEFGWQDFSALALAGAAIAAFAAALGWRHPDRREDSRFALVAVTGIGLALLAAGLALPGWALAPATAVTALAALLLGRRAGDFRIEYSAHAFLGASLLFLFGGRGEAELFRAAGVEWIPVDSLQALARWAIPAAALLAFARGSTAAPVRKAMEVGTVLLGYVALAQIVPADYLALLPAALIAALALTGPRGRAPIPALATAGALSLAWAAQPLVTWLMGAVLAFMGAPFYASELPDLLPVAIRIAAPTLALTLLLRRKALPDPLRPIGIAQAAVLATITAHVLWKQVFAIDSASFPPLGMAERTLWEAILAAAALAAWRLGSRSIAAGLGAASILHFALFTLLRHNPLWDEQAVGPWLLPAYGVAFALVWLSRHPFPGEPADRTRGGIQIGLILAFAWSALTQLFHGTWLMEGPVTQAEDISRSLLAIALAIGFLQWGIRTAARDWRIASLVLMLGAVGKVFLFDAAGLDGLLRIASFAALGFSLIGVGWLYTRYLPDSRPAGREN